MASRLDRLVTLLETGSTRLIRDTAASQLADWQKQHPDEQLNLLTRVVPYLRHRDWETRSTAAKAIGKIIENAAPYDPNGSDGGAGRPGGDASPDRLKNSPSSFPSAGSLNNGIKREEEEDSATTTTATTATMTELSPPPPIRISPDEPLRYDRLDLASILQHGRELLRTGAVELGLGTLKPPDRLAHQKKTLPARLGLLGRRAEDQELAVAGALLPAGDAVTALAATAAGGDPSSVSLLGGQPGRGGDEAGLSSRQLNSLKRKRKKEQKAAKGGGFGDLSAPLSLRRAPSDPAVGKEEDSKSNGSTSVAQPNDYYFSLDRPADVDEAAKVVSEFRGPALPIRSELEPDADGDWEGAEWPYERLCDYLKVDLFDPAWEIRHGAAMGLREVVRVHGAGAGRSRGRSRAVNNDANRIWLDDVACRLVCVLMLDRFTDYSSDTSVAPIRETVGQTLGSVLKYVPACSVYGVYGILYRMVMGLSTMTTQGEYVGGGGGGGGGSGKVGAGPTAPERAAAGWAVCHGGMVGLRYVVAVRKDLLLQDGDMIDGVARSVMRGLADRDDDVRSVSAATLIPMTAEFVAMRPAALDRLVAVVWEGLSDLGDDLSASTGRIMDLLATLCGFPEALEAMRRASAAAGDDHDERNDQPEEEREGSVRNGGDHKRDDKSEPESGRRSLTHLVPRLYPFLRHTITSVRLSALRALRTLAGLGPDARGWLAGRTLRLVFQNILVERDRETLEGSLALWSTLVGCLAGPGLAIEFGPHSEPMMELTLHPIGTLRCPIPMNGGLFLRPSGGTYPTTAAAPTILPPPRQPSPDPAAEERAPKRRRKSTKPSIADDVPATPLPAHDVDTAMMGGDVEQLGTDVLVRSRVAAARAMGLLMASIPLGGDVDGLGHSQYSLASYRANILHGLASAYSFTQTAACIVAEEHARSRLSMAEDQDESTKSAAAAECTGGGLAKALLAVVEGESRPHYRDLVDSLRRVRQECVQLLHVFRDQAKIPAGRLPALPPIVQGEPEAGPAAFSLALAERVAGGEEFDRLRHAAIPGQRLVAAAALEEARAVAAVAIREARVEAEARDVRVRAAAGCALIAMRTMPPKPSPLIRAVMDSIKMEETAELQKRSAAAVVRLVRLLGESGRRGPADKVVANLVKFSCVEVAETPEFGVHAAKTSCVLSLQKEEDRVDRGDGADAAEWAREARAARITRRGAREALETLARTYGPRLLDPDAVPCLRTFMADPLVRAFGPSSGSAAAGLPPEARDPAGPLGQEIVDAMSLIRTLAPTLDRALLDTFIADLIPLVVAALRSELAVFRYMAAKCMAGICAAAPAQGVTALVERVLPSMGSATDVHLRQGAVEAVYHLIAAMGDAILPYVIFLLVPVLGRMSDADSEVRLLATTAFATLVKLVPLEAGIPDPPGMPAELLRGRDRERAFIAQLLDPKKVERFEIPVSIRAELRPYQRDGVSWLHFLNRYHLHGILCDDMGLGKTLQTLCIVASDHHARAEEHARTGDPNSRPLPSLIVCPPTLAGHWQQELAAYAPFLSVVAYVGPPAERRAVRDRLGAADVVITSYDACRSDVELLVPLAWNYLVLDEGHLIKNPRSKTAIAVKRLAGNHRLILTGTPIQNNVLELWSLFDFLMPGFLGAERVFHDRFARPIAASRHARASSREQEAGALAAESLHKQVLPFLLRRLKEEVLDDLPPKILQNYYCTLSELQRTLFDDFVRRQGSRLRAEASDGDRAAKQHIFQALQYMRKLCNSPALVLRPGHAMYEDTARILRRRGTSLEDPVHAPKLTALRDLLVDCGIGAVAEGGGGEGGGDSAAAAAAAAASDPLYQPVKPHRALIFCQMKEMLDMVQNTVLRSMLPSVSYLRLDGSVEPGRRQDIVNRFNTDPSYDVLLLTTSVGGLGLNLTGADTVIFVEHDWNPQKDLQAMDRAHRIGQKKVVNVYRLITRGTLEEKILSLQRFKLDVAGTVVNQQNAAGLASMNSDQILDLFNLGDGGGAGGDADGEAATQPSLITERANKTAGGDDIREEDMVDIETGNVIQQPGKKKKPWLEELGELWDNRQYEESFDLDGFLKTMQ